MRRGPATPGRRYLRSVAKRDVASPGWRYSIAFERGVLPPRGRCDHLQPLVGVADLGADHRAHPAGHKAGVVVPPTTLTTSGHRASSIQISHAGSSKSRNMRRLRTSASWRTARSSNPAHPRTAAILELRAHPPQRESASPDDADILSPLRAEAIFGCAHSSGTRGPGSVSWSFVRLPGRRKKHAMAAVEPS
jgi:hypothetical protein